jgi:hypothetical protein
MLISLFGKSIQRLVETSESLLIGFRHRTKGKCTMVHDKLSTILLLLLLASCASPTGAAGDLVETVKAQSLTVTPIQVVADEFRGLRAIKGHFDGGAWNDDVDKWMGRKHQLMLQLGERLGAGEYSRAEIVQWLALPDQIAREGDEFFNLVSNLSEFKRPAAGSYELLIYYWRGTHDFLYFTVQGETVANAGWWYAGE